MAQTQDFSIFTSDGIMLSTWLETLIRDIKNDEVFGDTVIVKLQGGHVISFDIEELVKTNLPDKKWYQFWK